ncbi:2OG-Fe(II) oxygenase family protein, partial [Candidatus Pelagibacter sp.]|nr:2OG-Fe(II) oxygenase family protein [Candidatus Pelagibacter sp.]
NYKKTNPGPTKNNLALKYNLDFIEKDKFFNQIIEKIMGKKYEIILKKFIVATPKSWIPSWVFKKAKTQLIPNLNNYIRPEFRDCTFFRGIDYHMDMIDHLNDKNKYITLYVYLNKVSRDSSPINILKKSYIIGAETFPHNIKKMNKNYFYLNKKYLCKNLKLIGNPGDFFIWSGFTLHGTEPSNSEIPRISIRYTIKKKNSSKLKRSAIDNLYKNIKGKIFLKKVRNDINEKTFKQKKFKKTLKS